jgi:hypothetical protein
MYSARDLRVLEDERRTDGMSKIFPHTPSFAGNRETAFRLVRAWLSVVFAPPSTAACLTPGAEQ